MEDPRCCGTGTCIINAEGLCWCGQRWDGKCMSFAKPALASGEESEAVESGPTQAKGRGAAPD
jgi:hypothetical protein